MMSNPLNFPQRLTATISNYVNTGQINSSHDAHGVELLSMKNFPAPIYTKSDVSLSPSKRMANLAFMSFSVLVPPFTIGYALTSVLIRAVQNYSRKIDSQKNAKNESFSIIKSENLTLAGSEKFSESELKALEAKIEEKKQQYESFLSGPRKLSTQESKVAFDNEAVKYDNIIKNLECQLNVMKLINNPLIDLFHSHLKKKLEELQGNYEILLKPFGARNYELRELYNLVSPNKEKFLNADLGLKITNQAYLTVLQSGGEGFPEKMVTLAESAVLTFLKKIEIEEVIELFSGDKNAIKLKAYLDLPNNEGVINREVIKAEGIGLDGPEALKIALNHAKNFSAEYEQNPDFRNLLIAQYQNDNEAMAIYHKHKIDLKEEVFLADAENELLASWANEDAAKAAIDSHLQAAEISINAALENKNPQEELTAMLKYLDHLSDLILNDKKKS